VRRVRREAVRLADEEPPYRHACDESRDEHDRCCDEDGSDRHGASMRVACNDCKQPTPSALFRNDESANPSRTNAVQSTLMRRICTIAAACMLIVACSGGKAAPGATPASSNSA